MRWPFQKKRENPYAEIARGLVDAMSVPQIGGRPKSGFYGLDNPIYYSVPASPKRRPGMSVSADTIRGLAKNYDVLRACIQHMKREISAVQFRLVGRDNTVNQTTLAPRIMQAEAMMESVFDTYPSFDPRLRFQSQILEDVLTLGNAAIYTERTRGGRIRAVHALDVATIRPVMDGYGHLGVDGVDYQQWVQGVCVAQFSRRDLMFDGLDWVSNSPYPTSPVEWLIMTVSVALESDKWNESWLTDGNTVSDVMALPEHWTPEQVREWAIYWANLMSGDTPERQRTKFVPSGTQSIKSWSRKDQDFQEFMTWLSRRTCAVMGVQPAALGLAAEQYKVAQEGALSQTSELGTAILLKWLVALYDWLLRENGFSDLRHEVIAETGGRDLSRAQRSSLLVQGGIITPNEARQAEGLDPIAGGDTLRVKEEPSGSDPAVR